jgi:signal transduction histidine kinase
MRRFRLLRDVRTRLLLIVLAALTVALAAATYGFNALLAHTTANNVDALLRQRVDSERAVIQIRGRRIKISETSDDTLADSRIWIYRGTRSLEAPPVRAATRAAARALAGSPERFVDVQPTDERLYAAPLVDPHGIRIGTIVAGVSVAPYEQTRREALIGSLALVLTLLALVGIAVWWLLRSALQPVVQMTEQADSWSEHDLDRRFELGEPHDELTRLAATLDRLLDRISASLRHERRFSAELSHELRTPLSKVIAETELALRRERDPAEYRTALEAALRNAQQVGRIVDALVAAAQHEASARTGTADAAGVAWQAVENVAPLAHDQAVDLEVVEPEQPLRLGLDAELAERVLQPLLENACRYGRSRASVVVARAGGRVLFRIDDDGPGVTDQERETIFEPGVRGSAGAASAGAGLGLALARRLARAVSGDVHAELDGGGGHFVVSLPSA